MRPTPQLPREPERRVAPESFEPPSLGEAECLGVGRQVIAYEAQALTSLGESLGSAFVRAVDLIAGSHGRVIVLGMGKSGHVARKMAATLASTGTSAFFLHAAEALHGDMGIARSGDVVIAVSNSGETPELCEVVRILKLRGASLVAVTGRTDSTLSAEADVVLDAGVIREADPFDLVPTASTAAASAMGDALAVALMVRGRFGPRDFADNHPAGTLGRRLSTLRADSEPSKAADERALQNNRAS